MENVAVETSLGFHMPGVGVSIPSQSSPSHVQEQSAAHLLGQQTHSIARTFTGEFVFVKNGSISYH